MSAHDEERTTITVSPPGGLDSPSYRAWAEEIAEGKGYSSLRWEPEMDKHGHPMVRLTGVRK